MIGRPYKSFERINRIFPECIEKLEDRTLSPEEKRARQTFVQYCFKVCSMSSIGGSADTTSLDDAADNLRSIIRSAQVALEALEGGA